MSAPRSWLEVDYSDALRKGAEDEMRASYPGADSSDISYMAYGAISVMAAGSLVSTVEGRRHYRKMLKETMQRGAALIMKGETA